MATVSPAFPTHDQCVMFIKTNHVHVCFKIPTNPCLSKQSFKELAYTLIYNMYVGAPMYRCINNICYYHNALLS